MPRCRSVAWETAMERSCCVSASDGRSGLRNDVPGIVDELLEQLVDFFGSGNVDVEIHLLGISEEFTILHGVQEGFAQGRQPFFWQAWCGHEWAPEDRLLEMELQHLFVFVVADEIEDIGHAAELVRDFGPICTNS